MAIETNLKNTFSSAMYKLGYAATALKSMFSTGHRYTDKYYKWLEELDRMDRERQGADRTIMDMHQNILL